MFIQGIKKESSTSEKLNNVMYHIDKSKENKKRYLTTLIVSEEGDREIHKLGEH